jgi:hypothetical protein
MNNYINRIVALVNYNINGNEAERDFSSLLR